MDGEHFELGQIVKLKDTNEGGPVTGYAVFTECESQYLIRYVAADGKQVEQWWGRSAIEAF